MALTKQQCLNFLTNKKNKTAQGSVKYYTIGIVKILVEKDIITPADVVAEFPELNQ
jgi:hypothetical protein